ncbi:hypothetical protein DEJ16_02720 [Curtobacterium sp. MCJR17_055]|uniref:maleylpyruvate isomerase N-terminal domain-containing protein n=1 Tax=unclassified Curtobacterium TaxID=257496 RepID=UPI000D8C8281|nr:MULTISPECIES: maleylpyruvate isomerase N-terminal domain-containing protein [unclassified Curtobacterium]PYY36735.1 hypothetical protein DEI87_03425 [Curtobacterium sp. MCBD17_029]PYY58604.1 hypothetical protein DEJ16_02720 [Curtobacterium sp. MCJR17_055]PYY59854.1 hypothetical protein DEJ26_08190 [Curtobacterium sp. MCPF17_015]
MDTRALFAATAQSFVDLVAALPSPAEDAALWSAPALGVWDLRALVGHTNRALVTVATYATAFHHDDTAPESRRSTTTVTDLSDAVDYLRTATGTATDPDEVAARGVSAGSSLGTDPAAAVSAARDDGLAALAAVPSGARISVVGGLRLPVEEYLRTRMVELVVHGSDITRAAGAAGTTVPFAPPQPAVVGAAVLLAEVGAHRGDGPLLLAALTGRGPLPAGYSVL